MVYSNKTYKKDLKYLNRNLRRVITIESNIDNLVNKENAIILSEFNGNK